MNDEINRTATFLYFYINSIAKYQVAKKRSIKSRETQTKMKLTHAFSILQLIPLSKSFSLNSIVIGDTSSLVSSSSYWVDARSFPPDNSGSSPNGSYPWSSHSRHSYSTRHSGTHRSATALYSSADDKASTTEPKRSSLLNFSDVHQNRTYIEGLLQNLSASLDRWIITGSHETKEQAYNILKQIKRESVDEELFKQAIRMAERASIPMVEFKNEYQIENGGDASVVARKTEAEKRKEWEVQRQRSSSMDNVSGGERKKFPGNIAGNKQSTTRSALSNRSSASSDSAINNNAKSPQDIQDFAKSKKDLEDALSSDGKAENPSSSQNPNMTQNQSIVDEMALAEAKSSEIVAKAGSGSAFEGSTLGIGGLDEVLAQVKRRVWVPLAAPPSLLKELGINPVRGLLLYGMPGCGKTLLARSLGKILSPARPITVVSGPEIMDKFVGSSEANLRAIFDNPPEIYDTYRIGTKDNGAALEKVALHVIILDEFDAMARTRGGRGGGDQGDAGVARDSVVNQLLAKMDGVDPLVVPTLVIGMTNRRSLIEPALLRPGRFEVQIEVPRPKTAAQRISILNVHLKNMFEAGRLLVKDAPDGTVASKRFNKMVDIEGTLLTYNELLDYIAVKCDGMSGASLAGVARAAASRALERAVCDFAGHATEQNDENQEGYSIADCLVTVADFESAIQDVLESSREGDGGDEGSEPSDVTDENDTTAAAN